MSKAEAATGNEARAARGTALLAAYVDEMNREGSYGEDAETTLADVLADLRHMCDTVGVNYLAADMSAEIHYLAEAGK